MQTRAKLSLALCLLFLPFLDKYTIAHSNFSVISCHAPWMMLANIGIHVQNLKRQAN